MSQEEQIQQLQKEVYELKQLVYKNRFSNLYVFDTPVQFRNNIVLSSTGSSIGNSSDKLSFFGATSVVQQDHVADPSGGATVDSQARGTINAILQKLENYGLLKTS